MGLSAEARQGLEDGFRRRVVQRRRQLAVNRQHAVRIGQVLGMGEPLGIYCTEIIPPLGARRTLRLLSPILVLLVVVVLLVLWAPDVVVPVIGVAPFVAGAYGLLVFVLVRRRRFTRWLYGYVGGMAEVDPDGQPRPVRWDEVTDVVDEWSSAGPESQALWFYEGFRLTTAGGRTVSITARYDNALDPYGPAGGVITALMPAEVGAAVPRFTSIGDLIIDRAVTRVVARQVEAVRGGGVIVRGDVRVTRDGIAGPKDVTATPWAVIERIELRPGHVKVHPTGGKARKYDNYRDGSGHMVLCRLLVALGVNASYEARG